MFTITQRALTAATAAVTALSLLLVPATSLAQQGQPPSYATQLPSYATRSGETIRGTISSFDGGYNMYVRDVRGYLDSVTLHQGTVINPTGITLQVGFPVTIYGRVGGTTLLADQIDTPFQYSPNNYYGYGGAYPFFAFGLGLGLGYRCCGYGYGYGYRRWWR
jgi:hypothetical protein